MISITNLKIRTFIQKLCMYTEVFELKHCLCNKYFIELNCTSILFYKFDIYIVLSINY